MKNRTLKKIAALTVCLVILFSVTSPAFAAVGKVYTAKAGARLRKQPEGGAGNDGNIIKSLSGGTQVVHLSSKGNWWRVRTEDGQVGYVFNSNLRSAGISASDGQVTVKGGGTYTVKASALTVRKSPTTNSKRLGSLRKGSSVKVVAVKNGWAKIKKNGRIGYVSVKYLG